MCNLLQKKFACVKKYKVSIAENKVVVSVVVPVYNTAATIKDTLDSLENQTLNKSLYEVIIVDDCSTDKDTIEILEIIKKKGWKSLHIKVIRHKTNKWLSETRNTGVKASIGKFVCCLDSDDTIDSSYLKTSIIVLEAYPKAGWVCPTNRHFGYINEIFYPKSFDPKKYFLTNYSPPASVFRKSVFFDVGGWRKIIVWKNIKFFEDWDFWIRAMGKGWYAIPCKEMVWNYRQSVTSMMTRSRLVHFLSIYLVYRKNISSYLMLFRSKNNYKKDVLKASDQRGIFIKVMDKLSGFIVRKLYKESVRSYPTKLLMYSIFFPRKFIELVMSNKYLPTSAEKICGFNRRLNFNRIKFCI